MSLSKKLTDQQLLKARNEALLKRPAPLVDDPSFRLPTTETFSIQSGLEKLRQRVRKTQADPGPANSVSVPQPNIDDEVLNSNTSFLRELSESPFELDDRRAAATVRLIQLLCGEEREFDPRAIAFLDTETTGLSGGSGTVAFLVGVGRWTDSGFTVDQYLMRDYHQERAMLLELRERLTEVQALVTFNGKSFDIPLLQTRFVLARQRWPLAGVVHLDLLHPARRIWKLRLANCSLANLERELLGIVREGDIPGHLIPHLYFRYVRTRDVQGIRSILTHNRQDIESLARLTLRTAEIFLGEADSALMPEDLYSAGKYAHSLGERELSMRWNEEALLGGLPKVQEIEARKAQAARLKEQKRYSEAAALWRNLTEHSETFLEDIEEELAIYHEHRARDLPEALRVSERALERLQDEGALKKWERRRARVARKLARRTSVETQLLFHSPDSHG